MDNELHKMGLRLKFFYSVGGLILGFLSIVGGCFLFWAGVAGHTSWTFKALGIAENSINDAAPGAILFVVGLFIVIYTRFGVKHIENATGSTTLYKKK
jgi:hypothetical protein